MNNEEALQKMETKSIAIQRMKKEMLLFIGNVANYRAHNKEGIFGEINSQDMMNVRETG